MVDFVFNFIDSTRKRFKEDKIIRNETKTAIDEMLEPTKVILNTITLAKKNGFLTDEQRYKENDFHLEFLSKIKYSADEITESYNKINSLKNKLHSPRKIKKLQKSMEIISFQKRSLQNLISQKEDFIGNFSQFIEVVENIDKGLRNMVIQLKGKSIEKLTKNEDQGRNQ